MSEQKKANTQVTQSTGPIQKPTIGGVQRKKTNIDFTQLSWGTLRKYQYFFRVKTQDKEGDDLNTREAVESAVVKHFEDLKIDYDKLIYKFLKIKKDEKNDQLYNLRKSQRARASNALGGDTGAY
ncbi:UNKNOWN [Stylonychia lemnae]|uniref:Histone deacetylase complex subunit SAP30 Sin3 binding domain-containing protein n=1 Tax=Stylonychia lemnae TaxID=5949 RepID=A0A078B2Q6_STYLE|nr:UNKNOWN [Stylonychia lemnae]|eukprot:CDW88521.1 UNKNOWN [Stylonychia lemnae]